MTAQPAVMWYSCDRGLTLDIPYGLVVHSSGGASWQAAHMVTSYY